MKVGERIGAQFLELFNAEKAKEKSDKAREEEKLRKVNFKQKKQDI